jgi:hypothetical protein
MSDGFAVDPEQIRQVAQAFAKEQDGPGRLGTDLRSCDRVDTGESGLDSQIAAVVEEFETVLSMLGSVLEADGVGLQATADAYEHIDDSSAKDLSALNGQG